VRGVNHSLTKTTKLPCFVNGFAKIRPNRRPHPARFCEQRNLIRRNLPARMTTMTELTGKVGFASPNTEKMIAMRRHAGVELIATLALAVSLMVAVTAVSIGVARAQACRADTITRL
jgi:hypothetical protein